MFGVVARLGQSVLGVRAVCLVALLMMVGDATSGEEVSSLSKDGGLSHEEQWYELTLRFERVLTARGDGDEVKLLYSEDQSVPFRTFREGIFVSLAGLAHSEGAQFFGLAHELAHVELCHMRWAAAEWKRLEGKPLTVFPVHITRRLHQFEYDADLLAFRWLNLLGRDALGDALDAMRPLVEQRRSRASETHPLVAMRQEALLEAAATSGMASQESRFSRPSGNPLALPGGQGQPESFCSLKRP